MFHNFFEWFFTNYFLVNLVVYTPYYENIDELNIYGSKISIIVLNLNFNGFFAVVVKIVTKLRPYIVVV